QVDTLGDLSSAAGWSATRNSLHGFWFNSAGSNADDVRRIVKRTGPSAVDLIVPVSYAEDGLGGLRTNSPAWSKYLDVQSQLDSDVNFERTLNPHTIAYDSLRVAEGELDLQDAITAVVAGGADPLFLGAETVTTFSPRHGLERASVSPLMDTYFERTRALIDVSTGGSAIESAPWRVQALPDARTGFFAIYDYTKSQGKKFYYLANRGVGTSNDAFVDDLLGTLQLLEESGRPPDVVAISNQGDNNVTLLPPSPELDSGGGFADSITGALLAALDFYGAAQLPGDYNNDGTVDAVDYVTWRDGNSPDSTADGYLLWRSNFGASLPTPAPPRAEAASTPEPAALAFMVAAAVALAGGRPRPVTSLSARGGAARTTDFLSLTLTRDGSCPPLPLSKRNRQASTMITSGVCVRTRPDARMLP
ncbi:MAG: hypothetical protein AAGB00_01325, partial [Planctomycetota bacterium]